MAHTPDQQPHLNVQIFGEKKIYGYKSREIKSSQKWPVRNYKEHGDKLKKSFNYAISKTIKQSSKLLSVLGTAYGYILQIECLSYFDFKLEFFENEIPGVQLLSVTPGKDGYQLASIFIPSDAEDVFRQLINSYSENISISKAKTKFIEGMESFEPGTLSQLWTDSPEQMPTENQLTWWEVWILPDSYQSLTTAIQRLSLTQGKPVFFPDRTIFNLFATFDDMQILCLGVGGVAELRQAGNIPSFFMDLSPTEQQEWAQDLLDRTQSPESTRSHVCLLDTGVNRGHRLLAPFLNVPDCHSFGSGPLWPTSDNLPPAAHGTLMAGVTLYGDLADALASSGPITINHRLESVRILPTSNNSAEKDYGPITSGGVALAEASNPPQGRMG
ncbi:MAG: S8 family serine peptidase [Magnetococcales bacterium]|nr:S8 family serine peptidase [Magnetococcales bacterium]